MCTSGVRSSCLCRGRHRNRVANAHLAVTLNLDPFHRDLGDCVPVPAVFQWQWLKGRIQRREIQRTLWLYLEKRRHPLARWLRLIQVASASFGCENALCPNQRGIGTASMVETVLYTDNFSGVL